jgi:hypothetical protein
MQAWCAWARAQMLRVGVQAAWKGGQHRQGGRRVQREVARLQSVMPEANTWAIELPAQIMVTLAEMGEAEGDALMCSGGAEGVPQPRGRAVRGSAPRPRE